MRHLTFHIFFIAVPRKTDKTYLQCYNRFFLTIPLLDHNEDMLNIIQCIRSSNYGKLGDNASMLLILNSIRTLPDNRVNTDTIVDSFVTHVEQFFGSSNFEYCGGIDDYPYANTAITAFVENLATPQTAADYTPHSQF